MSTEDKVVLRFDDGKVLKGYLKEFSQESQKISFEELGDKKFRSVAVEDLKAIFFVRGFEGDKKYKEQKKYGISKKKGRKIFIRFRDNESLMGYLEGDMPWDKGFFLSKPDQKKTGFFILPGDEKSNNIKVYVIKSAVKDIAAMP